MSLYTADKTPNVTFQGREDHIHKFIVPEDLIIKNNASSPDSKVDIDCLSEGIDLTVDIAASGANGLHTGSERSSMWYAIWLICGDNHVAGLLAHMPNGSATSTSAGNLADTAAHFSADGVKPGDIVFNRTDGTQTTVASVTSDTALELTDDIMVSGETYSILTLSPELPDGYSFKALVGAIYNGSDGNFDTMLQQGREVSIASYTAISNCADLTYAANDLAAGVPPIAKRVGVVVFLLDGTTAPTLFLTPDGTNGITEFSGIAGTDTWITPGVVAIERGYQKVFAKVGATSTNTVTVNSYII